MEFLHLTRWVVPDFLTDDFGTLVQVIPGAHCLRHDSQAEQTIINHQSWGLLFDPTPVGFWRVE